MSLIVQNIMIYLKEGRDEKTRGGRMARKVGKLHFFMQFELNPLHAGNPNPCNKNELKYILCIYIHLSTRWVLSSSCSSVYTA